MSSYIYILQIVFYIFIFFFAFGDLIFQEKMMAFSMRDRLPLWVLTTKKILLQVFK